MKKIVLIYGVSLSLLAFILKTIEYKWLIKDISWQMYGLFVAIMFCLLGIWLGSRFVRSHHSLQPFETNHQAIESLGLSRRELQVLQELVKGLSNQEIAVRLFISINTVKTHLKNSYAKLDVNNRVLAIERLKSLNIFEK